MTTSSSKVHDPITTDQRIVYAPANVVLLIEKVVFGLPAVNVGAGLPEGTLLIYDHVPVAPPGNVATPLAVRL